MSPKYLRLAQSAAGVTVVLVVPFVMYTNAKFGSVHIGLVDDDVLASSVLLIIGLVLGAAILVDANVRSRPCTPALWIATACALALGLLASFTDVGAVGAFWFVALLPAAMISTLAWSMEHHRRKLTTLWSALVLLTIFEYVCIPIDSLRASLPILPTPLLTGVTILWLVVVPMALVATLLSRIAETSVRRYPYPRSDSIYPLPGADDPWTHS